VIEVTSFPSNWRVVPAWSLYERVKRTGNPDKELLSVYRDYGVIPKSSRDDNHNVESEDLSSYQLVQAGDLVVNKMKAWQGSFAVSDFEGIVSPAYFVYKSKHRENSRFLHYLLRSAPYMAHYNRISSGVRIGQWDLDPSQFRVTGVGLPPREEQDAIVEFLDRELAQIDALLSVQLRLKDLIEERLESRILKTVCGNTVETSNWLGALPIGWGKVPLREVATIQAGGTPTSDNETYWLDGDDAAGIPWLNIGDFDTNADITSTKQRVTSLGATSKNLPVGSPGTIVFAMYASVGSVSRIGMRASWSQAILGIQTRKNYSDRYLYWVLRAFKNQLPFYFRSNTQNNINASQVRSFMLPYPPLDEQLSIAVRLDQKSKEDQFLLQKAQSLIDALTERRAAIIAEAVTGKVHIKETL
jgi:type I restriction enzyme, S subunit